MAFNNDRDSQSSNDRTVTDTSSVTPIMGAKADSVVQATESKAAGVYDVEEKAEERTVKTGVYDRPAQKSGSMFSKFAIVAVVIIVGFITYQILF